MKEFVINVSPLETRIGLIENKQLVELMIERQENPSIVGNIYKGRVDSVIPGMQAAFIDIGFEKNGFLYVSDIAGAAGTGDVELVNGMPRAKTRARRARQQPIETMLKKNQYIMVQVVKDRLGNKGARLTNFITIPGRYAVYMPTTKTLGVSRKIEDRHERDRLRDILNKVVPKGMGMITRTAGEGRTRSDFEKDVKYLNRVWERTMQKFEQLNNPGLIREDLGPILRAVRDRFTEDLDKLVIDSESEYDRIINFLDNLDPSLKPRVRLYKLRRPIFEHLGIEEQIRKAMRHKVFLASGGHICIEQTEALVAIDVNTGKFTGKKQLEDTVLKTNLEAAEEIARQLRLRDLGGIIVCDFIDMGLESNRRKLLKVLTDALKKDQAKTTLSKVSELGLIEMTRKRVKHNVVKALSQPCPYCEGSGMVRSITTMTFDCLRRMQNLFCRSKASRFVLQVHPDVAQRLNTEYKELLEGLSSLFKRSVAVESMPEFHIHDMKVYREARNGERVVIEH